MIKTDLRAGLCAGLLSLLCATAVQAHATFEKAEAAQDAAYKGVIRIGHGCNGKATHTVRVVIPEGVIAVKPQPKAGWTVKTVTGPYARTYDYFGKPMAEGVKEITWSGGSLADSEYDEFVFSSRITAAVPAGQKLYIPVTQLCEGGEQPWTQVPKAGEDAHALKFPAPGIAILPAVRQVAQAGGHGGHSHHAAPAAGSIAVSTPWTRATPPGAKVAGGFMVIDNKGGAPDRLIGGSAEISNVFEVHEMAMESGVMKMRALDKGLEVKPGAKVELKPGSYHVMFIDLKRQLKEGETVKGELVFEKAGKVPVEFKVMPLGAQNAGHHHH